MSAPTRAPNTTAPIGRSRARIGWRLSSQAMGFLQRVGRTARTMGRTWASRRAGRRHVPQDIRRQARDVAGVTGALYSKGWDQVAKADAGYLRSFDAPRVPPSLHISERDRRRAGLPVPLSERCIEDHALPAEQRPGPWSTSELSIKAPPRSRFRGRRP